MKTGTLLFEARHAWRRLARSPGFFLAAMLMLSLGLGFSIFMFGGIKAYFMSELPYPEPQQLVHVELRNPADGDDSLEVPQPLYFRWAEQPLPVAALAAFHLGTINLSGEQARPERFDGAFVSANAFETLRARPFMGRGFTAADAVPGAPAVVVIGHELWLNRYLGDPAVIGKVIRVNARPATIIGVMPAGFEFPFAQQVWLPLENDPAQAFGDAPTLEVFARLAGNANANAIRAALASSLRGMQDELPEEMRQLVPVAKPYAEEYVSIEARRIVATLSLCVLFVLFIACVNVASLMIARSVRNQRESAVRGALGASRARLVAGVLLESLVVAFAAGGAGLLIANWGTGAIERYLASVGDAAPYWVDMSFDGRMAAFTVAASFLVALVAGLAPALRAGRVNLVDHLKEGSGTGGGRASRTVRVLVGAEIALSCILLVTTGLMLRSLYNALDVDLGAETQNVLTGRVGLFEEAYPDTGSRRRFIERLENELAAINGVEDAAIATGLPAGNAGGVFIRPEGVENPAEAFNGNWSRYVAASPEYFELFEIRLRQGRFFTATDDARHPDVAVITQQFADEYLAGGETLGRRIWLEGEERWVTVVGVAEDVVQSAADIGDPVLPVIWRPVAQTDHRFFSLAVKTSGNPYALQEQVRAAVQRVDADMPVYWLRTLDDWMRIGTSNQQLLSALLGIFTFFAVLLAGGGLYSVLAYAVGQRTREIGVRRALGASDVRVAWLLASEYAVQLGVALAFGLVLAAGFAQLLASEFVGVSGFDPLTYGVVIVTLLLLVIAASIMPARRALRIQPQEALRHE